MKKLIYILLFNISALGFAQSPLLFETDWFLIELTVDGENITIPNNNQIDNVPLNFTEFVITTEPCGYYTGDLTDFSDTSFKYFGFTELDATCDQPETRIFIESYIRGFYLNEIEGEKTFNYILNSEDNNTRMLTITNTEGDIAIYGNAALGINELDISQITIYPNPANNNLILSSANIAGKLTIEIFNIEGKFLKSEALSFANQTTIDVSNLKRGVYLLKIESADGIVTTKKFVKE